MKRRTLLLACLLPLAVWAQETQVARINGTIKDPAENYTRVFVFYDSGNGEKYLDSADVVNGKYSIEVPLENPVTANILAFDRQSRPTGGVMANDKNMARIYLLPDNIEVHSEGNFSNIQIKGGPAYDAYNELNGLAATKQNELNVLMRRSQEKGVSEEDKQKVQEEMRAVQLDIRDNVYRRYIKENPDSPILFYALRRYAAYGKNLPEVVDLFYTLPEAQQSSGEGKTFINRIKGQISVSVGSYAPDFTQESTEGEMVKLSSFRGKYVLLDFWASWCGPCRKENPNVVKAYEQFKENGFTVLGVSLDRAQNRDKWLKAIADDGLGQWTNVSDLKYWGNEAAVKYGVSGIPQNFLIDPEGKIVATNLRGEKLLETLSDLLL